MTEKKKVRWNLVGNLWCIYAPMRRLKREALEAVADNLREIMLRAGEDKEMRAEAARRISFIERELLGGGI